MVSAETRKALRAHYDNLGRWLTGSDEIEVTKQIAKLFSGLKPPAMGGMAGDMTYDTYTEILSEQPLWAIQRAVKDYLTGRAGDGTWAPGSGDLNKLCIAKTARYREEHLKVGRALGIGSA